MKSNTLWRHEYRMCWFHQAKPHLAVKCFDFPPQEAQLSQRGRAMLHFVENFAVILMHVLLMIVHGRIVNTWYNRSVLAVENGVPLKCRIGVIQGHWKTLSFDRSHTRSYWHSTVTMVLSYVVSEIKRDIGQNLRVFHYSHESDAPVKRTPLAFCYISYGKLEWWSYQRVFEDKFSLFLQNRRTWQTDRRTASHRTMA